MSPATTLSTTQTSVTVPITLTRTGTTSILGFSVEFVLSPNLGLSSGTGSITLGPFLGTNNPNTNLQITTMGPGDYVADGVTLGPPCGSMATSGVLLDVQVASAASSGTGTLTIVSVRLRDCNNDPLPDSIGAAATVGIDKVPPTVAVTSPNGGEIWIQGTGHLVTWNASDDAAIAGAGVDLAFSPDSGATWTPIATGLDNVGSYLWTVPAVSLTFITAVRVTARDIHGNSAQDLSDGTFTLAVAPLGVSDASPGATTLKTPVPDPFRQSATIGFSLAHTGVVDLAVFAVDGRRVRTLDGGSRDPGEFRIVWDGRDATGQRVPPGIYFVRLAVGSERFTRRLTLLE
ncbi:MAG: FlgD immunoglobulin-like domain containing protein [Candidatus Eisenbacteria bacterium]